MKYVAYIGLGSNIGEPFNNCKTAVDKISKCSDINIIAISKWYKNKALTLQPSDNQPDFINGAIKIETDLEPPELLKKLKMIESEMGRRESAARWEARIIDLDILLFSDFVIESENLTIPHPELHKRLFVLLPLYDIEPSLIHPAQKKRIKSMIENYDSFTITTDNRRPDLLVLEMDNEQVRKTKK